MPILKPGIYEAQKDVNIRREPKVVEYKLGNNFITNRVGQINAGTRRTIYSLVTNEKGDTWGRVSESDASGVAEWICIQTLNTTFMRPLDVFEPSPSVPVFDLEARIAKLEVWAAGKGYQK